MVEGASGTDGSNQSVTVYLDSLRIVRRWAKARVIYGFKYGFLGGISWAIMLAAVYAQMVAHAEEKRRSRQPPRRAEAATTTDGERRTTEDARRTRRVQSPETRSSLGLSLCGLWCMSLLEDQGAHYFRQKLP